MRQITATLSTSKRPRPGRVLLISVLLLLFAPPLMAKDAPAPEAKADVMKASTDGAAQKNLSANDYAKLIQSFYNTTKDYQATFVQTYTDLAAGSSSTSKGKVYIKQPGKMRWDYYKNGKRDKLYVSNGKDFWAYEFAFQQAFKQCLKGSQLKTSLSFLMGNGDLIKEFNISMHPKSTDAKPRLRLKPKTASSKFKELEFLVEPTTGKVLETVIYDPYGNSNTIKFLKIKTNRDLPDSGFEFKPPANARIINPDQKCN